MTKGTKKYIGICCIVFVLAVFMGIVVRFSFQGSTTVTKLMNNNIDEYTIQLEEIDEEDNFAIVKDYKELESKSEFIAKIKVTDDRELYANTIKTKVKLEKIYKSDKKLLKNDYVYIYELAAFEEDFGIYDAMEGYQLMQSGREYYVFLNTIKTAKGYQKSKEENVTYLPSTTCYSVIPVSPGKIETLKQEKVDSGEYCYKDIKNMEILTTSKEVLKTYSSIKKDALKK